MSQYISKQRLPFQQSILIIKIWSNRIMKPNLWNPKPLQLRWKIWCQIIPMMMRTPHNSIK